MSQSTEALEKYKTIRNDAKYFTQYEANDLESENTTGGWVCLNKILKINPTLVQICFVCLFDLGLTSLSTIFQSYRDSVWMWQGAQCSLLECCFTEILSTRHFDMIFHPVTLY